MKDKKVSKVKKSIILTEVTYNELSHIQRHFQFIENRECFKTDFIKHLIKLYKEKHALEF